MKFNLENLHWREFETLVTYYLKDTIGAGLWVFGGTKDQGRDSTFNGVANSYPSKSSPWRGEWIFQVKHRTTRSKTVAETEKDLLRSLKSELNKVFVKHKFTCNNYIYITNLKCSNRFRPESKKVFERFCSENQLAGIKFGVIEYSDLEVFIGNQPGIKLEFPSLLTFTDLEQIFIKKEETRNKGFIKFAQENIPVFVSTAHYASAIRRLNENRLLMIVGDPKSGKTSIVEALAVSLLEEGRFRPFFIRTTDELFTIVSYLQPEQGALFICDDIFGQHELDPAKSEDWTDYFQSVMGLIDENHRFVFTTRLYIFNQFARTSGLRALFPTEADESRYVIKVSQLTNPEREQILEKHLANSGVAAEVIEAALRMKSEILACKDFSPEVIRSLVALLRKTETSRDVVDTISGHLAKPDQYVYDLFNQITPDKRLLLLSIAVSPISEMRTVEKNFLTLVEDARLRPGLIFRTFIEELDRSIIKRREYLDFSEIEYYHPSMFDVIVRICGGDKYYRSLMLKHINIDLLWLLTLREAGEGSKIQLRPDDFDELLEGLTALFASNVTLRDATAMLQWTTSLSNDLAFMPSLQVQLRQAKHVVGRKIANVEFCESHSEETVEHWIGLLSKWQATIYGSTIVYCDRLESLYRNYSKTSYWSLVFLLEHASRGFIESSVNADAFKMFTSRLLERVRTLKLGLNLIDGRPKTRENWLPTFYEVDDLINKMKKSDKGRLILESFVNDWAHIKRYTEFARNRHFFNVSKGWWKTIPRVRSQASTLNWA